MSVKYRHIGLTDALPTLGVGRKQLARYFNDTGESGPGHPSR